MSFWNWFKSIRSNDPNGSIGSSDNITEECLFTTVAQNTEAISNMSSKLSTNTQYLSAQMQKLLELEQKIEADLNSRKGSASDHLDILMDQHKRLEILETNLANDALDLVKTEYKSKERHEHCIQRMNELSSKQDQIIDCIEGDRKVITELYEKVDKMDKLINKVARDIKKGEKAKAEKDVVVLKKADKVQDKKLSKLEKKEPKAKKKVKK